MKTIVRPSRTAFSTWHASLAAHSKRLALGLLAFSLAGCIAHTPMKRPEIEKLPSIELVRTATAPLLVKSFMSGLVGSQGAIGGAIAGKNNLGDPAFAPGEVPDFGPVLAGKMLAAIPGKAPWWPRLTAREAPVDATYVNPKGGWLKIDPTKLEVAAGGGRLIICAHVSLHNGGTEPLWYKLSCFSGLIHGGAKIRTEEIGPDSAHLREEFEIAANWLAADILADFPQR